MTRFFNLFRQWIEPIGILCWVPLILAGSGAIAPIRPAHAQRLPTPRIFGEELPPPSPSPSSPAVFNPPNTPLAPGLLETPPPRREYNFQAPTLPVLPNTPTPSANLYRVDVLGDSPFLLSQVQQIEPEAFIRWGEGMIQAGVFADQQNAQSRVRALETQGIRSRVTKIAVSAGFDSAASVEPGRLSTVTGYFVIVPGNPQNLPEIATQIVRLGIGRNAVNQRDFPRGPHVAVGPFDERETAERWSSYLRSDGLDARVYYGR